MPWHWLRLLGVPRRGIGCWDTSFFKEYDSNMIYYNYDWYGYDMDMIMIRWFPFLWTVNFGCFWLIVLKKFQGEDGKVRGRRRRELRRLGDLCGVLRCLSEAMVVPPPGKIWKNGQKKWQNFSSVSVFLMDVEMCRCFFFEDEQKE